MPDISPATLYDCLDGRRLALFVGEVIDEAVRPFFYRQLAGFVLQNEVATLVVSTTDPDLLRSFEEMGAPAHHIVLNDDLAAIQPTRPTVFSLRGLDSGPALTAGEREYLAGAASRRQARELLRQRLAGQALLCYGVDPSQTGSIPSAVGWPGLDPDQPIFLVWEGGDSSLALTKLQTNVYVVGRDPFDLIVERTAQSAPPGEDLDKGLGEDIDFNIDGSDDSPSVDVPPPTPPPPAPVPPGPREETLRIDAAVPERVLLEQAFVLAVAVRQQSSPLLWEADLTVVKSGEAQVVFQDDGPIRLRLRVSAPDCKLDGPDTFAFRLSAGKDSPTFYFNLTPVRAGKINIVIQLFQEDDFLGSSRLATQVEGVLAGQVEMVVRSQPLAAPPPDTKREVEEKERQRQDALLYLSKLEGQAVSMAPGAARAELEFQIDKQKATIKQIERAIDDLLQPA